MWVGLTVSNAKRRREERGKGRTKVSEEGEEEGDGKDGGEKVPQEGEHLGVIKARDSRCGRMRGDAKKDAVKSQTRVERKERKKTRNDV